MYLFKCVLYYLVLIWFEAIIVDIEQYLDLQLPMKSVPITTKVLNSNPAHGEMYSMQYHVIQFVSDLLAVCFIGGGNRSIDRICCIEYTSPWARYELTTFRWNIFKLPIKIYHVLNPLFPFNVDKGVTFHAKFQRK